MADFPYFSLYAADFLVESATMPPACLGVYMRCLCFQWNHGSIPNDRAKVARLASATRREIAQVWDTLVAHFALTETGDFVSPWLADQRAKVRGLSQKRAEAGRKGGRPRADGEKQNESKTPLRASDSEYCSSSSKNPPEDQEPEKQKRPPARAPVPLANPTDEHPMILPALESFPEKIRDGECRALWAEWLAYKAKNRKKPYKTGRGHLNELAGAAAHGREVFIGAINNAMDREWQGPNVQAYLEETGKAAAPFGRRTLSDGIARTRSGVEILPLPTAELVR